LKIFFAGKGSEQVALVRELVRISADNQLLDTDPADGRALKPLALVEDHPSVTYTGP
jgi:hypothetical protein